MSKGVAILICLLVSIAAAGAAELYQSNELGMELAPIHPSQRSEHQWVLQVERSGRTETRILTDKGKPYGRWELSYEGGRVASEKVYRDGELTSVTDYHNGRPVRRTEYTGGKPSTVHDYTYSGRLLESVSVSDASGTLLYRDLYSEGPDGRMRRAVRETPDGKRKVIALTFSGSNLVSEWLGVGGNGELLHYSDGSLVSTEKWKGTELQTEERVAPSKNGSVKVLRDLKTGLSTTKSYNSDGKIVSEVEEKGGSTLKSVDYSYNADGKVSSKLTKTPGRREEIRYHYDKAGELATSETSVNRRVVKVTHYTGKDSYVEDLYLNGALALHAYYEKGKLVREEPASAATAGAGQGSGG